MRELESVVRSALVAHDGRPGAITMADLGLGATRRPDAEHVDYAALVVEHGGQRAAARALGIDERTLRRRIASAAAAPHPRRTPAAHNPAE